MRRPTEPAKVTPQRRCKEGVRGPPQNTFERAIHGSAARAVHPFGASRRLACGSRGRPHLSGLRGTLKPAERTTRPRPPVRPAFPGAAGRAWGERAQPISGRPTASLGPRLGPRPTPDGGSGSSFTPRR